MKRVWFRAKRYGWGWYPVSWQGWLVTLTYTAVIGGSAAAFSVYVRSLSAEPTWQTWVSILLFMLWFVVLIKSMLMVCTKTGERAGAPLGQEKTKRRKKHKRRHRKGR